MRFRWAITRLRVGGYIAWHASRWFSQWHQLQLELGSWFSDLVVSCYLATTLVSGSIPGSVDRRRAGRLSIHLLLL